MKRELVTIAPAIDAFTSIYSPARSAVTAMINSVKFPSVAFKQPADCVTRLFGDGFGCMTKKGSKRNDCENCEHKQERVSGRHNPGGDQHGWHKYQHPQQRGMSDFP